jgi:hypothetical protein
MSSENVPMKRFAIYAAPRESSPWWQIWSEWLGRDAGTLTSMSPPSIPGIDPIVMRSLLKEPSRYGLHATIKAPFRLNLNVDLDELKSRTQEIALQYEPFELDLSLERLKNFFALTPVRDVHLINQLAKHVVRDLDRFRLPLNEQDIAKRRLLGLSPHEDQMLLKWGYPYVMESFRFHISLTGRLDMLDEGEENKVREAILKRLESLSKHPFIMDSLCLFEEPSSGADFLMTQRFLFNKAS